MRNVSCTKSRLIGLIASNATTLLMNGYPIWTLSLEHLETRTWKELSDLDRLVRSLVRYGWIDVEAGSLKTVTLRK